jgi:hypothetical protein
MDVAALLQVMNKFTVQEHDILNLPLSLVYQKCSSEFGISAECRTHCS